jgi:hypothetical protein
MAFIRLVESCPNLTIRLPEPPRLVRTFNSDFKPLPSFLQDTLVDWVQRAPADHIDRMSHILHSIQYSSEMTPRTQGLLWHEIQYIFRNDIFSQDNLYVDGRRVRNMLMKRLRTKASHGLVSPCITPCSLTRDLGLMTPAAPKAKNLMAAFI